MKWLILTLYLLIIHAPNGDEIELNANEVSSMREPRDAEGHFHKDVNCVIFMTNGRFIPAKEDCKTIHSMLEATK